jgi:hypothetical protein
MILDYKEINSLESEGGDLYVSLPFGYENKSEVESGKLLIINIKCFYKYTAILINSIKFSNGGSTRGMFISREFSWTPLCNEDKIKELIRDFKLEELGLD